MITKEQYTQATEQKESAQNIINQFHKEDTARFKKRMAENPIFTDEELIYSARSLCPCGHGLAYPKNCGAFHYWDCSAILKDVADKSKKHTAQLSFTMYDVKSESEHRGTTRGILKPKENS